MLTLNTDDEFITAPLVLRVVRSFILSKSLIMGQGSVLVTLGFGPEYTCSVYSVFSVLCKSIDPLPFIK